MRDLFTDSDAILSPCGAYRYRLSRTWDEALNPVVWVCLNPSTADASQDDPSIRRMMGFARGWLAGGIVVVNLFAARATDPRQLKGFADPVGPDNDRHILEAPAPAAVVVAWGAHPFARERAKAVLNLLRLRGRLIYCLGRTKDGHPRHPLFVAGDVTPIPFE